MTDTDKLEIKQIINDALQPIGMSVEKLSLDYRTMFQTLFGITGANGINGDLKNLRKDLDQLKVFKSQIVAIVAAIQAIMLIVIQLVVFWFKFKS